MIRTYELSPQRNSLTFEEFIDIPTGNNGYIDSEHSTGVFNRPVDKFVGNVWSIYDQGLNQARHALAGCGDVNNALSFGGNTGAIVATTEKFITNPLTGFKAEFNIAEN